MNITIESFCQKVKIKNVADIIDIVDNYYISKPLAIVYDDVLYTLNKLKKAGLLLIALSNKSYKNPFCLKSYGLDQWFCKEIYSYDVGCRKPDINIFRYAEKLIQIESSQILHVGDSLISDYTGAQKASWNSVLLCRNHNVTSSVYGCDLKIKVINSLEYLPEYIDNMC